TRTFVELVCKMQPTFFVMENVSGLYRTRKHREYLERQLAYLENKGNYLLDMNLLNALHFGAPQDRERLFVIGFRKRVAFTALGVRSQRGLAGLEHWFPWPDGKYSN